MVWLCRANALKIRERNRYKVQAKYFIHEWSLCARPYIHTFSSWSRLYPILTSYDPIIIIIAIIINHFRVEETEVQTIYLSIDLSIYLSIIYLPTYLCAQHIANYLAGSVHIYSVLFQYKSVYLYVGYTLLYPYEDVKCYLFSFH